MKGPVMWRLGQDDPLFCYVAEGLSRACFPKPKQFLNQDPHFNHIAVFKPKIHISIALGVVEFFK
jgi:hypothetical protein